jgi:Secretion system C-terminal sorting domain
LKIFNLVILFITSSNIAQSHAEYFPLQIGNKWVYKNTEYEYLSSPRIGYSSKEVIGDTIMDNGIKYFITLGDDPSHYVRFDTLTNEIKYYFKDTAVGNDVSIYSLNYIKDSTVVWNCPFSSTIFQISFSQQTSSDTSFINLAGESIEFESISFKKYIGIVYRSLSEISVYSSNLIGYRINGKEWGHLSGIKNNTNIPAEYKLEQNYPNPFNPATLIGYSIPKSGIVIIKVFDVLGREVSTLVNEYKFAGNYSVQFNAGKITSGVYFYRIESGSYVQTKKLVVLK